MSAALDPELDRGAEASATSARGTREATAGPRIDALPVGLGLAVGGLVVAVLVGLARTGSGLWGMSFATCLFGLVICWTSNTVAHLHLHRPLLRPAPLGRAYAIYLSALTGVPQTIWRARHLAHHRGRAAPSLRLGLQGALEVAALALVWIGLAALSPALLGVWAAGFALGMLLCQLQGRGEHLGGEVGGVSHYGRLYNRLWLNDGYHAEHHRWPGVDWRRLPALRLPGASTSPRPPHLRGRGEALAAALVALERLALRAPPLQRRMVATHAQALAALTPAIRRCLHGQVPKDMSQVRVAVVGGGLFPRSVLALAEVWPAAQVTVIEADADHLARARAILAERGLDQVHWIHDRWSPGGGGDFDLVVLPLALVGDRDAAYAAAGPPRLIHDWIWRRRGVTGVAVAWWLGKRINLVAPER